MSYQENKSRNNWIRLIECYGHVDICNLLWRLKVITQNHRMFFVEETHKLIQECERKRREDVSYVEDRPRWGKPTYIKHKKADNE